LSARKYAVSVSYPIVSSCGCD